MNQKKVRALRKQLKSDKIDFRDREYNITGEVRNQQDVIVFAGSFKLKPGCGRHIYKSMKANNS